MLINTSYLSFSDAAKFADIARNIVQGRGFISSFEFFGGPPVVSPVFPYLISLFFRFFGVSDQSVIYTSLALFVLSLVFTYLLATKLTGNKLVGFLSVLSIGFNKDLINYGLSGASESLLIFEIIISLYLLSLDKKVLNIVGFLVLVLMYLTRPQSVIYIFGILVYFYFRKYSLNRSLLLSIVSAVLLFALAFISSQGIFAITQVQSGAAVSDSLRGVSSSFDLISIIKKSFYNLYNFYKLLPNIINPYLFVLFILSFLLREKNKNLKVFGISSLISISITFLAASVTIPFYRYIHPVVPFVYILACYFIVTFISEKVNGKKIAILLSTVVVLLLSVFQTLGEIFLDSRFEARTKNMNKPPIYVLMSNEISQEMGPGSKVLTNLDTWGSWYGERKTVWFPVDPEMVRSKSNDINAIYLTSYKIDDENYYMGKKWREIFNNPESQKVLPEYKFVSRYTFSSNDNFENEDGRAVLLIKKDADK